LPLPDPDQPPVPSSPVLVLIAAISSGAPEGHSRNPVSAWGQCRWHGVLRRFLEPGRGGNLAPALLPGMRTAHQGSLAPLSIPCWAFRSFLLCHRVSTPFMTARATTLRERNHGTVVRWLPPPANRSTTLRRFLSAFTVDYAIFPVVLATWFLRVIYFTPFSRAPFGRVHSDFPQRFAQLRVELLSRINRARPHSTVCCPRADV
jgi:hypothetical protein